MNLPGIAADLQGWFATAELAWWQAVMIGYICAGVFRIILDAPFFYHEWKSFDERLNQNMSSMEIEQMSTFHYGVIKFGSIGLMLSMALLVWPLVQTNRPIKK